MGTGVVRRLIAAVGTILLSPSGHEGASHP